MTWNVHSFLPDEFADIPRINIQELPEYLRHTPIEDLPLIPPIFVHGCPSVEDMHEAARQIEALDSRSRDWYGKTLLRTLKAGWVPRM